MKTKTKIAIACITVFALLAVLSLRIEEMGSGSMEPLIQGKGSPPGREGDRLLILKRPFYSKVEKGHLVLVELPAPQIVITVRRVASVMMKDGIEEFVLEADAPDGLDSRHFGPVRPDKIFGRLLRIMR
jgi:type IV secretory pathway protease TraF